MKPITTLLLILLLSTIGFSQSKSFITLKEKFSGRSQVVSLHTSGFLARAVLKMAGEHEFVHAIKDIKHIRLMVIPKEAFKDRGVTLNGFKKFAKKDSFQEVAHVRDHGDDVTLLMQSSYKSNDNRYLLLVDDDNEVVAIEVKGYIDPQLMLSDSKNLSY